MLVVFMLVVVKPVGTESPKANANEENDKINTTEEKIYDIFLNGKRNIEHKIWRNWVSIKILVNLLGLSCPF